MLPGHEADAGLVDESIRSPNTPQPNWGCSAKHKSRLSGGSFCGQRLSPYRERPAGWYPRKARDRKVDLGL